MFIQTEETPNPATLKFLPGVALKITGTLDMPSAEAAKASPLAEALFGIDGVRGVFLGRDFITVTKEDAKDWRVLKPPILTTIMDHLTTQRPILLDSNESLPVSESEESETVRKIRHLLDTKVRPAVAQDGGDITFQSFEDGVVYLKLKGACAGCPSSVLTLKAGIETMLKKEIPEVEEVRQAR